MFNAAIGCNWCTPGTKRREPVARVFGFIGVSSSDLMDVPKSRMRTMMAEKTSPAIGYICGERSVRWHE